MCVGEIEREGKGGVGGEWKWKGRRSGRRDENKVGPSPSEHAEIILAFL